MTPTTPDLRALAAPFLPEDVEWKPGATTRDKSKGLAMPYISSRAVQDRLDDVCGPAGWKNAFTPAPNTDGGVLCGISIRVERADGSVEWITKWDGAENTDVEAVKGGLSGAMKRAAVQWGIGRYLYNLPPQWVRLDERGRFADTPRIPAAHQPQSPRANAQTGSATGTSGNARREQPPTRQSVRTAPQQASRASQGQTPPAPQHSPQPPRVGERRVIRPASGAQSAHAHRTNGNSTGNGQGPSRSSR